jgi:large subunit ribosomal protein L9
MKVILIEDVEHLGEKHDLVSVKDGYARNYLIPKKLAVIANQSNQRKLEELKRVESSREAKLLSDFQEIAAKIQKGVLKIGAKAGTSGKIFGSVTNVQIAQAIKEQLDVEVDRKNIELLEEVKELGTYSAKLLLHSKVQPTINFEVVQE